MRAIAGGVAVAIAMAAWLGPAGVSSQESQAPVYKPPPRGAPGGRVGGGTRGTGGEQFVLSVLAPAETGLTSHPQPVLYWYISTATTSPIEFTVTDSAATQPLLETRLQPPAVPGIQRIRLADHGVRLAPGVAYRWFVAVVPDAGRRSRDLLAGGAIELVELPAAARTALSSAPPGQQPAIYAEAGFWYDAVAAVSELIEGSPANATLKAHRASLMTQVGLPTIPE
jgi:hypothetical protein